MKPLCITLLVLTLGPAVHAQQPGPPAPDRFVDVPADHWAYQAVENLRKQGILLGYPDGRLRGKRTVTRYEAAAGLNRVLGVVRAEKPRVTTAPGLPGPPGPRGLRGPSGVAGPRAAEVDLFRALVTQLQIEVVDIRRRLADADAGVAEARGKTGR